MSLCRYVAFGCGCNKQKIRGLAQKRQSDIATGQKLLSDDIRPNGQRAGGCQVDVRYFLG